ncbi:MAG: Sir2 family NAD-dependent protein deacetylase [Dehalococcoidales bacterium]
MDQYHNPKVDKIAELILQSRRLTFFTGAGASTESGIPDFRGPGGIWGRFDPEDFSYERFLKNPNARRRQWKLFKELSISAEPNNAHLAIAELHHLGKLDSVITQNIDNLHQKAGVPEELVLELHGNMRSFTCLGCGKYYPFQLIMTENAEDNPPHCKECGGILKANVVFFGEPLPEDILNEAIKRACSSDLMIVIGSGLTVYPASYIPAYAVNSGSNLVIINLTPTPFDDQACIIVNAKAGETMFAVVEQVKDRLMYK